ncbi:unnamed protein product [Brassica rapa subsp. narinosa]|uniref:(rape) hypothetical protein n=1 Tax=Brassica napus TaxID=3708 RepID=A0A816ZXR0_BRANA|nr:unnamed protein product [Brassica napus]
MAKESSGGGGGEAEQEEEERWRKRDDKDTQGRRGYGKVDGRRQHMWLRRLDLALAERKKKKSYPQFREGSNNG